MKKVFESRNDIVRWGFIVVGATLALFAAQSLAVWLPFQWARGLAANSLTWPIVQVMSVLGLALTGLCLWLMKAKRIGIGFAVFAALCLVPSIQGATAVQSYAREQGVQTSFSEQFHINRSSYAANEPSVTYGTAGQTKLDLSSYLVSSDDIKPAVVYVHGGGWSGGSRTENSDFFHWLNGKGYHVFSIDYRTARDAYASWKDAPGDVACALSWLNQQAGKYHVDTSRVTLMGDSAGGQLALRAAYGLSNGDISSSCGGQPVAPRNVVGIVPAIDFIELYDDPVLGPTSRDNVVRYLGGTPDNVPQAYEDATIITHVRPGVPRTLLISAENDTLVSADSSKKLAVALHDVGVDVQQYTLPGAIHSYWINPGGYQNQISRALVARFLKSQ